MKKSALMFCLLVAALVCGAQVARAQGGASRGPDPSTVRDSELEKESTHNLEVARHYFKLKKAYRAALARCEEIIAANPNFAMMDETLYIAGESSLLLSENKGKQKPTNTTADKLRGDARDYLSRLVNEFPESPFREQAEKDLTALGGAKAKESSQKSGDGSQ
ncbi:MAG: outer membrane protein assembly factor BamD [Pyrinomonadaceae bacterium]